jgi:hypothetical protein
MTTPIRMARPWLAAALSLLATTAMATATSSATMSVSYQLIDLDPLDGVAPVITFNTDPDAVLMGESGGFASGNVGTHGLYTGFQLGPVQVNHGGATGASPFASTSAQVDSDHASARSSVLEGGGGLFVLNASGEARSGTASGDTVFYGAAAAAPTADGLLSPSANTLFTVSANTLVLFAADVTLIARTTLGGDVVRGGTEMASASYGLSASGYSDQFASSQEARSNKSIEASYTYTGNLYDGTAVLAGQALQFNQRVRVAFSNPGASSLAGRFSALVTVAGNNAISPVPEAEAWLLMLAGVGVVWTSRRPKGLQRGA